jgi:hypothetical protein
MTLREPFVVVAGSPRSGTTLLRNILKGNSKLVVHLLEPQYVLDLYRRFGRTITDVPRATQFLLHHHKFPRRRIDPAQLWRALEGSTQLSLSEFLRAYCRLLRGTKPDSPLVLKEPTFMLHLDLIKELFPDLFVIHIVRDPRANAFSQRTRWPSTSLWMAAHAWQSYVDAGQAWEQRRASPLLQLRYEDLVSAPDDSCRKICDFLNIPMDPAMLALDHVQRDFDPTGPGVATKRLYQGLERHRVDKWRSFMQPAQVKLIERQCHRGMALFRYDPVNPQVSTTEYLACHLKERRKAVQKSYARMKRGLREQALAWKASGGLGIARYRRNQLTNGAEHAGNRDTPKVTSGGD